jgi:hypothetical protein
VPVVDRGDGEPIHELQRAGLQAGGGHLGHRDSGRCDRREEGDHCRLRWWGRPQPERRLGHDPERALRADEEVRQRIAGHVLHVAAAGADDAPIGQHDLQREDRIAGHAVLHAAQATRIGADVPADRAELVARRIRRVEEPISGDGRLEVGVDDARLYHRNEVGAVDLDDPVHSRHRDRQRAIDSRRAAGQAASRTARDHRHAVRRRHSHELGDFGRARRQRDGERQARLEVRRLVAPIRLAVGFIGEEAKVRQACPKVVNEGGHGSMVGEGSVQVS